MAGHDLGRTDELRDHLLVLRCQAGDERAFATLMGRFGPRTLAYLRGVLADDAEDVQQEVWLAVYRGVAGLANPGAFRTWLYRTTRHRAIDFLRRRRRERELLERELLDGVAADATTSTDEGLAADGTALEGALAALPAVQREVLMLRYQHDMTYEEIALVIGRPVGTVRSRIHHAKGRVHELLERGEP